MKFSPESLIEIYLNGSFTEEAQAEFDKLIRRDPVFAEQVTQAVAERVGPAPESLERISANLDSKIDGLWQSHKPSPYRTFLNSSVKLALVVAAAGGLYGGFRHYWTSRPLTNGGEENISTISGGPTANPAKMKIAPGRLDNGYPQGQASSEAISESPAVSESNLSTPLAPQIAGNHLTIANPALSPNKGLGEPGQAGSFAPGGRPSVANVSQAEEGFPLRVSFETDKKQNVVMTVLDSNGILVRHLYQGQWNAGVHFVDWDGKDGAGNPVPSGNYTVIVNADGKIMSGTVTVQPSR